jgi:Cof subfamily protein (haloacid dehalogenase superfamily)
MKKFPFLLLAAISSSVAVYAATSVSAEPRETRAASGPVSSSLSSKMNIDLNDNSETDIRSYYSSLNSLSASERTGTNLLKNLKPILQNFIDTDTARRVVAAADKYGLSITTYHDGAAVTERARDEYFSLETRINLLEKVYVDSLYDYIKSPVPKFLITGEGKVLEKYEKILRAELDGVTVFRSEPFFLEIVPKSVDKGASLKFIGNYLKIPESEIMACGDGFNDVSLLNASGFAVAMGNAQRPVLECADYITLSNEEDGLGEAIRRFCL